MQNATEPVKLAAGREIIDHYAVPFDVRASSALANSVR
jgi:hypothetical protein